MGPPLKESDIANTFAVGSVTLTHTQQKQIDLFLKERYDEAKQLRSLSGYQPPKGVPRRAVQYCIVPPAIPPSPKQPFWRYSCVGFVLSAYKNAAIELLHPTVPHKSLAQIKTCYNRTELDDPNFRAAMGIGTGHAWPLAFPGYVLTALDRPDVDISGVAAIPYQATQGDEFYPARGAAP